MKIAICASMVFAEKMVEMKRRLEEIGYTVFISQFAEGYPGKAEKEKEAQEDETCRSELSH